MQKYVLFIVAMHPAFHESLGFEEALGKRLRVIFFGNKCM